MNSTYCCMAASRARLEASLNRYISITALWIGEKKTIIIGANVINAKTTRDLLINNLLRRKPAVKIIKARLPVRTPRRVKVSATPYRIVTDVSGFAQHNAYQARKRKKIE